MKDGGQVRHGETGGLTTTRAELHQAAKLSDEAGPPQAEMLDG